ncbi:MAG: biotin synthase BioB [Eubacteriales bacterium]|nr:biotin synthase BioB [Eubacteriales bacterium]
MTVREYTDFVKNGGKISRVQAMELTEAPLQELCTAANEIRKHFCGNGFDICTIINAKSGKCSENCKFCAQSAHYHTGAETYAMLDTASIVAQAKNNDSRGVLRYSLVTSGKRLTPDEIAQECESIRAVREQTGISVCISNGLLDEASYRKLREAGATRVHNNLETSRRYFPNVCTTHTFDEKCDAIRAAQAAGLSVCSGGIVGMGETMEDRIDLVLELRELGVRSVPVNMLNPVPGTPFAHLPKLTNDDMCRIVAVFRFLLPDASIRLAGGRGLLPDKGRACFCSGANAAISGDMLTTAGITIETDMALLQELGYIPQKCH